MEATGGAKEESAEREGCDTLMPGAWKPVP